MPSVEFPLYLTGFAANKPCGEKQKVPNETKEALLYVARTLHKFL